MHSIAKKLTGLLESKELSALLQPKSSKARRFFQVMSCPKSPFILGSYDLFEVFYSQKTFFQVFQSRQTFFWSSILRGSCMRPFFRSSIYSQKIMFRSFKAKTLFKFFTNRKPFSGLSQPDDLFKVFYIQKIISSLLQFEDSLWVFQSQRSFMGFLQPDVDFYRSRVEQTFYRSSIARGHLQVFCSRKTVYRPFLARRIFTNLLDLEDHLLFCQSQKIFFRYSTLERPFRGLEQSEDLFQALHDQKTFSGLLYCQKTYRSLLQSEELLQVFYK